MHNSFYFFSLSALDTEFLTFLKNAVLEFGTLQRKVTLHIDGIHIKADFTYKGGKYMVLLITLNPLLQLFFVSRYQVSSINGLLWFVCYLVHPILLIVYFRYLNKSY